MGDTDLLQVSRAETQFEAMAAALSGVEGRFQKLELPS